MHWFARLVAVLAVGLIPINGASVAADGSSCVGLDWPVAAAVTQPFAPRGRFAGHWGIDLAVPADTEVRSAAGGTVTFAGTVAGNLTTTVDHGGGLKTSYSYLSQVAVSPGSRVGRGRVVGATGIAHGSAGLHFSVRVDGVYVDPQPLLGCRSRGPGGALRLVPVSVGMGAGR